MNELEMSHSPRSGRIEIIVVIRRADLSTVPLPTEWED